MQKMFRRNDPDRMAMYMSGLMQIDPSYVWQRFCIVVMEDASTGIAQYRNEFLAFMYLASAKYKRVNAGATDDDLIRFARYFSKFPRDRAACDTIVALHRTDSWKSFVGGFAGADIDAYLAALEKYSFLDVLAAADKSSNPAIVRKLCEAGAYNGLDIEIAATGMRLREGSMFTIYPEIVRRSKDCVLTVDDPLPEHIFIGAYPGCAFDMHTSDGKQALRYFIAMREFPFVKRLSELFGGDKEKMLAGLAEPLFFVEIGRLARRASSTAAGAGYGFDAQKRCLYACTGLLGVSPAVTDELVARLWDAIPALNYARQKVVKP
jgi:hypothetical protein